MYINVTLIIQIFNFLIAYTIIRVLLLKPAVTVILENEKHQADLQSSIDANTRTNKTKQEVMAHHWAAFKQACTKHSPEPTHIEIGAPEATVPEMPPIPEIDAKALEPVTKKLTAELVERISHVR